MNPSELTHRTEDILRGSFDLHVHAGPDPTAERRVDALDTARQAQEAELAGFVLKSHDYPTAALAHALTRIYPGLTVAGSIALNPQVGGLNPEAVQAAVGIGARVVWMPTFGADFYRRARGEGPGLRITDDSGGLEPQVRDILDIASRHEVAIASGHVAPAEANTLFRAAREAGVERLIATHPTGVASVEEMQEMASLGAYIEHTFLSCMPSVNKTTQEAMAAAIKTLGPERCVLTSDFGQWMNPPPAEGLRMAIAAMLDSGLSPEQVTKLVKSNPLQLMGMGG
jgi:hypothetical protein